MKLIKLLTKFDTPLKEDVKAFFPRDLEKTLKSKYILVSDAKFRLLEFAKVGMYVYNSFDETAVHDMDAIFPLREEYIIVKEVVDPANFDADNFDPSAYDLGDYIFFYKEAPVKPIEPEKPKFHSGTFNYELTETQKKILWDAYEAKLEEYKSLLENYKEELKTFKESEENLPIFGCLGLITKKENDIPGTVLKYYDDKKLLILLDCSFETTKDVDQFGVFGKIPKGRPTLVGTNIGGLKAGTSLKRWSYKQIIEQVFGLEFEKDKVGTLQPEKEEDKASASVSYGEGKTSIGSLTDTATITVTFKLSDESEATTVKLMQGDTVVESKSISESVTFTVTGLNTTTTYKIVGVHTDSETGEEVIDCQTSVSVVVNFVGPTANLSANPSSLTSVGNVTLTATVAEGSSAITKVELFDNATATGTAIETETSEFDNLEWDIQDVDESCTYSIKVTDANGLTKTASASITVETPASKLWWGNYAAIASQVDRPEADGDIKLEEVTVEGIQEYMTLSQTQSINAAKGTFQINVPDFHGKLEQQLVLVPTSVGTTITFVSNGFDATTSFEKKVITVDGIEYTALLSTTLLYDDGEIDMHITIA